MKTFTNYNFSKISLNKFKNETTLIKQYEFKNCSFCINQWLAKRLLTISVGSAVVLMIQNLHLSVFFALVCSLVSYIQFSCIALKGHLRLNYYRHNVDKKAFKKLPTKNSMPLGLKSTATLIPETKKEKLLFIPNIGFQETVTYATGRTFDKFHEISYVTDIIINELVSMYRVTCYLSLVCQNGKKEFYLQPLFSSIQPKLEALKNVYADLKPNLISN